MKVGPGRGPGIAERLRAKMREHGYWLDTRDRPAAMRFAEERGYDLIVLLRWLDGVQPSWDNLYRLAGDFDVTPAWLLFGEDGGRELVKDSTSASVAKKPRAAKRSRAAKIIGAVALLGAALSGLPMPAEADLVTTNYVNLRRRRERPLQLALDLVAA